MSRLPLGVLSRENCTNDFCKQNKAEGMISCLPAIYSMVGHSAVLSGSIAWQSIRWDEVRCRVKSIQSRIVKAVKASRWNKVKVLQGILSRSYAARLLAIRKITENTGKRTPGIDGELWNTPEAKFSVISKLKDLGYQAKPVRRITIPKGNGKRRPLLGLDPVSESTADYNSYGFRPVRCCADAIARCFSLLSKRDSPCWILEADIKGCFDNISKNWMLDHIPTNKKVLQKWLTAGYVDKGQWYLSKGGTPQGSVISPTLANMVLDGMENWIDEVCGIRHWGKEAPKRRVNNPFQIHLVRYADDFIITSSNRAYLENKVKPAIEAFLSKRGLRLNPIKTYISHIDEGFDFLGQNVRKYENRLLIKPSKKSVKTFLEKISKVIKQYNASSASDLIYKLSPMIRGWAMYHRHVVAKQTFQYVDNQIWKKIWRWAKRRHYPQKNIGWIKRKYFKRHKGMDWTFFGITSEGEEYTLFRAGEVPIERHPKIKGRANPYLMSDERYYEQRQTNKMLNKFVGRQMMHYLYRRQSGKCPVCGQQITASTGFNAHHITPKYLGGKWEAKNLKLLHPVCHIQVHQNPIAAAALS